MTKIDSSYLEKLGEVLYDEKAAVNYKTVSIMFGVHVNIAKQMLYHFYTKEKSQNKNVYATYYVSGMLPRKALYSIGKKEPTSEEARENNASQESYCSPSDELDSFLVLICKDKDLEEYKRKFTKIFSIHVYSLSAFPLENYDALNRLVERYLIDNEGRTPVDFGPVTCSASQKLVENSRAVPIPKETPKTIAPAKSTGPNSSTGSKPKLSEDVNEDNREVKKSSKPNKPVEPARNDPNRLKNMFEKASAKPKTKVETSKSTVKTTAEKSRKTSASNSDSPPPKNSKSDNSRKRKRIRDVLSSSESEEEKDSDDDEALPESPVPKKRIQIESDSDDDVKKTSPKSDKQKQPAKAETKDVPGRKRVTKTVSKSYVDKDGFLVTTKEHVVVSEDEDSAADTKKQESSVSSNSSSKAPTPVRETKPTPSKSLKTSSGSGPGKTKQSSLMSFFQKK